MKNKIEEDQVYKLKGHTINTLIELTYRIGKHDQLHKGEDYNPAQIKDSLQEVTHTLLSLNTFNELNN